MHPNEEKFFDPATEIGRVRRFCLDSIIRKREQSLGDMVTNNRFLFYEAVMAGLVNKEKKPGVTTRPDQIVSKATCSLREYGYVEDYEIEDRTRQIIDRTGYPTIHAGIQSKLNYVRLDPWHGSAPLLVVESESLAGLIHPLVRRYRCVLVPLRGQCSRSHLMNKVKPYIDYGHDTVLCVCDFDKAGGDIENSARQRLEDATGVALTWTTVALTAEQVETHDLPLIERKDKRDRQTRLVCETEAMPQEILMGLIEQALEDAWTNELTLDEIVDEEERQRELWADQIEDLEVE